MSVRRHTLLVVDDEPDVVKSVRDLLRLEYNVLTATTAQDGLKLMQEHEVHVVMSDQRMPGMTGVQLLKAIRGEFPEAIRLLFTGYADIRAVIDAINDGNVYRYITKPWDPDELQSTIREACERYDLIRERNQLMTDLQKKNTELEQANQLKLAFLQVASHELRTPLTILLGVTDLARRSPTLTDQLRGQIERIKAAGNRLMHLVNQILTMLSAGDFKQVVIKEPVDVNELLNLAADDILPFIELRHQHFNRDWPAEIGTVPLEKEQIRDALNHLLLNAIKFTPDGGTISLSAKRPEENIEITVTDTGVGIEESHIPHLFTPFFTGFNVQHHSTGLFEYGKQGIGLGLSVVHAFVQKHGGTLTVKSEVGKGTSITMTLPA